MTDDWWFHIWFWLVYASNTASAQHEINTAEISKNMSAILNFITNKEIYDKRLRPNYGGPPVDVNITIHVSKLGAVSEIQMDFTLDIDIRQTWEDPRLRWKGVSIKDIKIKDWEYLRSIWTPDTFFPNEKKSSFHHATVNQTFVHLKSTGVVTTFQRITITAGCSMNLRYFPLDSQMCELQVESYGYSVDDIRLNWNRVAKVPVKLLTEAKLPTFELDDLSFEDTIITLSTGNYSRLSCQFKFVRVLQFYWIQIYQPSILVVMVSWVAFWISRDSAPARVTLGITTVLTMTTLMSTTNQQMPKVSYVKAVDIYLVVCYIMVIAALIEYAAVSYSNKKKQDIIRKTSQAVDNNKSPNGKPKKKSIVQEAVVQTTSLIEASAGLNHSAGNNGSNPHEENYPILNFNKVVKKKKRKKLIRPMSFNERIKLLASKVDKYSRFIFPSVFAVFNIIYWIFYLKVSGKI